MCRRVVSFPAYLHVCFHERGSCFHQVVADGPVTQGCSLVENRLPAGGPSTCRERRSERKMKRRTTSGTQAPLRLMPPTAFAAFLFILFGGLVRMPGPSTGPPQWNFIKGGLRLFEKTKRMFFQTQCLTCVPFFTEENQRTKNEP